MPKEFEIQGYSGFKIILSVVFVAGSIAFIIATKYWEEEKGEKIFHDLKITVL